MTRPRDPRSLAAEVAFRARLEELGATLLEPAYLGSKVPHRILCAAGHSCRPAPSNLRNGQGPCRTCAGQDPAIAAAAFRARLAEMGAALLEPEWLGSQRKHHVRCKAGHDCHPKPNDVQQGRGICRICSRSDPATAEAAFKARLAELGATLTEPGWLGVMRPHRVTCAAGHDCSPRPNDVQQGHGICLMCAGKHPAPAEARFLGLLTELGATALYEKWLGIEQPHRARCSAGHECRPTPATARRTGSICPTCSGKDPAASEAKFLARLKELGAVPLYETWRGSHEPHRVRCAIGHEPEPTPAGVLGGNGACRYCAGRNWDVFYVVAGNEAVKFGITSGDPRPRLRYHATQGYAEVVRVTTDLPGTVALDAERAVKQALAMAGERPVRGKEYFDSSCLALVLDVADSWLSPAGVSSVIAREWVQAALFAA